MVVAVPGAAAAEQSIESADRTINQTTVEPGDTIEATVTVTFNGSGQNLSVDDLFDPAFGNVEASALNGDYRYNGTRVEPSLQIIDNDIVLIGYEPDDGFSSGDNFTMTYRATVPENASDGQVFTFNGSAGVDSQDNVPVTGPNEITVDAPPEPANYQLSNLSPAEANVTQGDDPVNVSVDVANTGDDTGQQNLTLAVTNETGDTVLTRTEAGVSVAGGDNQTVVFQDVDLGSLDVGNYSHTVTSANDSVTGSLTVAEPFDFGLELEQNVTVEQGADANISTFVNNRAEYPVDNTTVELLVDSNGDGDYTADEVVASKEVDMGAGEYREIPLIYTDVQLDPGEYDYVSRISKDGETTRSFTNGTLTVEAAATPASFQLSNLDPASATVTEGQDPINISVDVENTGDEAGQQDVTLEITDDAQNVVVTRTQSGVSLNSGENRTIVFEDVDAGALDTGNYTHTVTTENDSVAGSLTVQTAPDPANYQLSNLSPAEANVTKGDDPTNVSVDVANTGDETGQQDLTLEVTNETGDVVLTRTKQDVSVAGGNTQTVTFQDVDLGSLDTGNYTHQVSSANDSVSGSLTVEEDPFAEEDGTGFGAAIALIAVLGVSLLARRRQ